jgi:hypothetical protein
MNQDTRLAAWHQMVATKDMTGLEALLADEIHFRSPFYWKPYVGKAQAIAILSTVAHVFENFKYEREWLEADSWALEFSATIGGLSVKGIDLIQFDAQGKMIDFEVMVRPFSALQALGETMRERMAGVDLNAKG